MGAHWTKRLATRQAPVDWIRVTAIRRSIPGPATYIDENAVRDDLPTAEAVIETVAKALPHLTIFSGDR
jgi:hypothetical protein